MYLYEKVRSNVRVWDFEPKEGLVKKFKIDELAKVPDSEKTYNASTTGIKVLEKGYKEYDYASLDYYGSLSSNFHREVRDFESDYYDESAKRAIRGYINGEYDKRVPFAVKYKNGVKHFILTKEEYRSIGSNLYLLDNIIFLPDSLYLLQLLNNGNFSEAIDFGVNSKLLRLFSISDEPVKVFHHSMLVDAINYGLLNMPLESDIIQMESSSEILKRMKRLKRR